jgi:hypothetical protein
MIATTNSDRPKHLSEGLWPAGVGPINVSDPPVAEVKITREQASPSVVPMIEDWWFLPPAQVILHVEGWTFERVLAYSKHLPVIARGVPEWLLRKWDEERPWWLR